MGHIEAETVRAPLQPEADHIVDRPAHSGIEPVQIGLLRQEMCIRDR